MELPRHIINRVVDREWLSGFKTDTGKTEHTLYECTCRQHGCQYCEGGLASCTVCGGAEGTLSTHCPGVKLNEYIHEEIYHGGLDFINGEWAYAVWV